LAVHAFTVGGIGMIILGMISRVSLGHTGRRLHPSPAIVAAYVLIAIAAIFRVFGPWLAPTLALPAIQLSGFAWILAFSLFLFIYTPILLKPRADGRPG
jgi:uncharacterized protein involved in response to NO